MANSLFTSSVSRSRPMKLVRAMGRLCLLAAPKGEVGASSSAGKPAAGAESVGGKVPAQIPAADEWWPPRALSRTP